MTCGACGGTYPHYYKTGRIQICENCIKNTYVYQKLAKRYDHKEDEKENYTPPAFHLHAKCMEYDSVCRERERFLERMYFDVDRLIWDIDSHKYNVKKKHSKDSTCYQ